MKHKELTKQELIKALANYFDEHFKWQKLVNDWTFDYDAANAMSYTDLNRLYKHSVLKENY